MANIPSLRKAFWFGLTLAAIYPTALLLLTVPSVQRHALYVHLFNTKWWQDPNKPEQFGFSKDQVMPFFIPTPDGERLYTWHILPSGINASEPGSVWKETLRQGHNVSLDPSIQLSGRGDLGDSRGFEPIHQDPKSRLIISFHGNAGTVSQGWRPDFYRKIANYKTVKPCVNVRSHVLAVDYRGFGYSSGFPTEQGLIKDAIATVRYALDVMKFSPDQIVIVGQSLGTAVSIAVAEHFVTNHQIEFQGIVLIAAFSDLPTLLLDYKIGGIFPILSPLKQFPRLQKYFTSFIQDDWQSIKRVQRLAASSKRLRLMFLHAEDDHDIPWTHTRRLFHTATNATHEDRCYLTQNMSFIVEPPEPVGITCETNSGRIVEDYFPKAGHNRITTEPMVAIYVHTVFNYIANDELWLDENGEWWTDGRMC